MEETLPAIMDSGEGNSDASEFAHDIFISYSSNDRPRVQRFVEVLERKGWRVWWDRKIDGHDWAEEIQDALEGSRLVVALISGSAYSSGYVYVECQRARADNEKLLPVRIEDRPWEIRFDGLTALIQRYDHFGDDLYGEQILNVIEKRLKGKDATFLKTPATARPIDHDRQNCLAYCVALAVYGPTSAQEIAAGAASLEKRMVDAGFEHLVKEPKLKSERLQAIRAVPLRLENAGARGHEFISFKDEDDFINVLHYFWSEYDFLIPVFTEWLEKEVSKASKTQLFQFGNSIGVLAQSEFIPVFTTLIQPWILSDDPALRLAGQLSLAVAAMHPPTQADVQAIINRYADTKSDVGMTLAVEMASGYLPAVLPALLPSLLQKFNDNHFKSDSNMEGDAAFLLPSRLREHVALMLDPSYEYGAGLVGSLLNSIADFTRKQRNDDRMLIPGWVFLTLLEYVIEAQAEDIDARRATAILRELVERDDAVPSAFGQLLGNVYLRNRTFIVLEQFVKTLRETEVGSSFKIGKRIYHNAEDDDIRRQVTSAFASKGFNFDD